MAELKPCPFCACTDINILSKTTGSYEGKNAIVFLWLECNCCGAKTKSVRCVTGDEVRAEDALTKIEKLWNIRKKDAVEVVRGHWAEKVDNEMYWYECSVCGGESPCTECGYDFFSPYCPNCGAKMYGGVNDG